MDVRDLNGDARLREGHLLARWDAWWRVGSGGRHRLVAETDGIVTITVDGAPVLSGADQRARAEVDVAAGVHRLSVELETASSPRRLRLQWIDPAGRRRDVGGARVLRAPPSPAQQARFAWGLRAGRLAWVAWLAPPLALLAAALVRRARRGSWPVEWVPAGWGAQGPRARRVLRVALPALVVLYAGALRAEALIARYAWQGPPWALRLERALSDLRPPSLRWLPYAEEYGGDPLTYLRRARSMSGLYEADVREPLFPGATRALLPAVGDRAVAVNAASAVFSTLLVLATYLLGAAAFGPAVGLLAAALLAVDRDAIWWGVEGFRDDAFAAFTVLAAAALLRLRRRPSALSAVLAGIASAAACLTRVTALSFLLPAHAVVALGRGPEAARRRKALGLGLLVALLLAGPYFLACALAYGDPLYAVNFHTRFYRSRVGMAHDAHMSWLAYLQARFGGEDLVATGIRGLTTYPFTNKWQGLDWVTPWLRRLLAPAAVAGLALFAFSPQGRLLLAVLLTALLPYAFTWRVPGGAEWRFTLPAYPFYLIAAALAAQAALRLLRRRPPWPRL